MYSTLYGVWWLISVLSDGRWRLEGQGVDQPALHPLKHGERVLVGVKVLPPTVVVPQVLRIGEVGGDTLNNLILLVSGVLGVRCKGRITHKSSIYYFKEPTSTHGVR